MLKISLSDSHFKTCFNKRRLLLQVLTMAFCAHLKIQKVSEKGDLSENIVGNCGSLPSSPYKQKYASEKYELSLECRLISLNVDNTYRDIAEFVLVLPTVHIM